jgi:hypothetical protein
MARVRVLATKDGDYSVLLDDKPVRTSLSAEEAEEVMASLAYLEPQEQDDG